jgi:hypothetical protein
LTAVGLLEDLASSITAQSAKIEALSAQIAELRAKVAPQREIYTLSDLAELPESPSLKTLRNNPDRQPNAGQPDGYRGAAKAWRRETVEAWRRQLAPRPDSTPLLKMVRQG